MRLFRYWRRPRIQHEEETPLQRFVRFLVVGLLFAAVAWGFSENNKRQLQLIKERPAPSREEGPAGRPLPEAAGKSE